MFLQDKSIAKRKISSQGFIRNPRLGVSSLTCFLTCQRHIIKKNENDDNSLSAVQREWEGVVYAKPTASRKGEEKTLESEIEIVLGPRVLPLAVCWGPGGKVRK